MPVAAEVDVLVVGGGPAGFTAAICASRQGAETMLIDRYGYLGGLANGALVILMADMDNTEMITVAGLVSEYQERMEGMGGLLRPSSDELFKASDDLHNKWYWHGLLAGWGRYPPAAVAYGALIDIETSKYLMFQMAEEAKVKLRLHSWCTAALTEGNTVTGVVLVSKSGYQVIKSKIIIDTTGDGDVFSSAGAEFVHGEYLISQAHLMANVDTERLVEFCEENPEKAEELNREVRRIYGGSWREWFWLTPNPSVVWCNCPHIKGYDAINVEHLTFLEHEARKRIWTALDFVRKNYPGFENASVSRTSDQIGVRQSRLLVGEYTVTMDDVRNSVRFDDTVGRGKAYYYPYRCFVPKKLDNLLVAGRHSSFTPSAQKVAREWPPCMVTGQAVGNAAALALDSNVLVRQVDVPSLQNLLIDQGVIL